MQSYLFEILNISKCDPIDNLHVGKANLPPLKTTPFRTYSKDKKIIIQNKKPLIIFYFK